MLATCYWVSWALQWVHLTASCPAGVSSPTLLALTNTAHRCCPPGSPPPPHPGIFAQKLRERTVVGDLWTWQIALLIKVSSFINEVSPIFVLWSILYTRKEFVVCSLSFKDKVALSSVLGIPAFRYIQGKSPHLTLMILGLTQYKCFAVNFWQCEWWRN